MSETDSHLAVAKAKLDRAIAKLNEELAACSAKKKATIPRLEVQQIASGCESIAGTQDPSSLVEKLILLNISADDSETKSKSESFIRKASDFLDQLVPLISVALGIVGRILNGSTMAVPVTAITNGTCFLLELAAKEKERKDQFLAELDRISYQARRVHELQRHPEDAIIPLMREKCLNLLTAIVGFLSGGLKYLGQNIFKQIGKSLFMGAEVWKGCISNLHLACEEYDQALLLQIASTVIAQSQKAVVQSTEDGEFRKWLTPSTSENDAKLMANLAQRAEGTLQWVLELPEFREWRLGDASAAAKTLWFTGLPGTGKSTVSAYLYDLLMPQYPEDIVLSFFCKRGTPGLTTAFNMVRTLCYQLATKEQFYRKFLQEKPRLPEGDSKEDLIFFFNTLIKEPLSSGPKERTIFILLDGLDELEDSKPLPDTGPASYNTKSEIEILLEQLVTLPRVKILVASRQLPELNSILSKSGTVRHITGADNAADIEKYVEHRVEKSPKLRSGFSEIKLDPVQFFSSKANGIFLWASVVLDVLERAPSTKSFKQALDEVPPTMNSIYDDIFARAEQRRTLNLMLEVLRWTVILPNPFTVRQMAVAAEISLGDKVLDMEDFLRTECGALLNLVPTLGARTGSDKSLEIHIGHETFQAWLAEKFGPQVRWRAHGKAARTCLLYLLNEPSDDSLRLHAITRWRWHLRLSMGIKDREFAEPLTALEGGTPLPQADAAEIFGLLYKFLSSTAAEQWVEYHTARESHSLELFWETHNTCVEIAAWCRTNKEALLDQAIDQLNLEGVELSNLKTWRDTVDDLQTITRMIWPRICHAWLWNTSYDWWTVFWALRSLNRLHIYGHDPTLQEETPRARALVATESELIEKNAKSTNWKKEGELRGSILLHLANTVRIEEAEGITRERCGAITAAGGFDDMSGVCSANLSIFLYQLAIRSETPEGRAALLEEAQTAIQDAIDEDPDGAPRNYYHLGKLYEAARPPQPELALKAYRAAVERDPNHTTDARCEVYQAQEDAFLAQSPPAYAEAAELLERAIADDPANAGNRWFHHLFEAHKKRGDPAAARDTYKRLIAFDPTWHSYWEQIANTYIDTDEFERKRSFNWRSWCDTLAEAASEDPSYADVYWRHWESKAEELAGYQAFEIAVDILSYGVETTAARTDRFAQEAYAQFLFRLGETLCLKGDWEAAVAPLEEAVSRVDEWRLRTGLKLLAFAHMALESWDEARAVAEKRLKGDDDGTEHLAHALLGETCLLEGKPANAIREYKSAIRILERWVAKRAEAKGVADNPKELLNDDLGLYYIDLALVYDNLGRTDQALATFHKALPHVRHEVENCVSMRTLHKSMWRTEGRWHARLAWLLEQLDSRDPKIVEEYELAVWVFQRTVYTEDDFVEITEGREAEAALERIRRGEKWVRPGDEAFKNARMRARISLLRTNWGIDAMDEVQKERSRGRT
jgi:tetratricopeptide (TPR) repeat protein